MCQPAATQLKIHAHTLVQAVRVKWQSIICRSSSEAKTAYILQCLFEGLGKHMPLRKLRALHNLCIGHLE